MNTIGVNASLFKTVIQSLCLSVLAATANAQINQPKEITTQQQFGAYTVHYTVFNSRHIPASVAEAYQLVRGRDRAMVNISLTKTQQGTTSLGLPAQVSGHSKNLMQQIQTLKFIEIQEGEATYYIAPFVFNNEDVLHFNVQVKTDADSQPLNITFNRTLYVD